MKLGHWLSVIPIAAAFVVFIWGAFLFGIVLGKTVLWFVENIF